MQSAKPFGPVILGSRTPAIDYTNNSVVANDATAVHRGSRKFWLDGSVILNGACIRQTIDLNEQIPAEAEFWSVEQIADWWSRCARNPSALYIEDAKNDWSACLPDPLGGAIAFKYETSKISFVSTDLAQLVNIARDHGITLEKDPLFQIERLLIGNGGLTHSSYLGVHSIDPFEYMVMDGTQIYTKKYRILDSLEDSSLFELFQQLRNDVLSSVNAIVNSDSQQVISHLTAGFDSRLVLSAILHSGVQNKVLMFCSGPEGSTDRAIADGLTRQYKLKRSTGAGLTAAPTSNMSERLIGPLFASAGLTSTGPLGRELSVPVTAMGGGYGEVLRTFYGNRPISKNGKLDRQTIVSSYLPMASMENSYVSDSATDLVTEKLFSRLQQLEQRFGDGSFVGDAFYTYTRNRYHIGQSSLLWSRIGSRFDPLYSVAGFELSRRMTQKSRTSNVLGFDLMDSLHSELLSFPFDYDRHNSDLLELRHRRLEKSWTQTSEAIDFEASLTPSFSEQSQFLDILSRINASPPTLTADERRAKTLEANKLGVNFWQVVYKNSGQEMLRSAFEQSHGNQIYDYIDPKYVQKIATSDTLSRQQHRDLYSLGGIMTWLSFG
ncbi:hypothetical protein ACTXJR_07835 [Glutamicibacter ardleyensis]|uniref:hypothetical protein n=1 Tax=Glutamicibacter ardleyensis TaxID=225894 RepID=UPI003FD46724